MATVFEDPMIFHNTYRLTAVVGLLQLGACSDLPASVSNATSMFQSPQLASQPGDACASERAAFGNSQSFFSSSLVSDTVEGGLKSMFSTVAGRLGSGSTSNLTTGLGPAALRGARAGYLASIAKSSSGSKTAMVQQMSSDLNRESNQVDSLHSSFARLQSCRFQQARLIKMRARSGQLKPDEAREQLSMERRLFDEELTKAKQSDSNMENRDGEFQYAAQELSKPGTAPVEAGETRHATEVATVTLPHKREAFASAVSDAEVRSKSDLGDDISAS